MVSLSICLATSVSAQTAEEAALSNMWLVLDICLQHHQNWEAIPGALQQAGVQLTANPAPQHDFTLVDPTVRARQLDFTIADITGYVALPSVNAYGARCVVATSILPQASAQSLIWQAYNYRFPGLARERRPQAADDCPMVVAEPSGNRLMMEALIPSGSNRCGPGAGAAIHLSM